MRNRIVRENIVFEREEFIRSIKRSAICELASSYHGGVGCEVFKTDHGSFNVCFFVKFEPVTPGKKPDKWVVRIPIPGRVPWIDEKINSEVATMKYVRDNTSIPVPDVIAFSYVGQSPIGVAFIIMEYVEGTTLHALGYRMGKRWDYRDGRIPSPALARVYNQLADIYIQLRGLEFPEIGALGMPTDTETDKAAQSIAVRHRPLPIEVSLQQAEGLEPALIFPEGKTFKTSREYIEALASLAANQLKKTQDPDLGTSTRDARDTFFAYYHFCEYVEKSWIMKKGNKGPFVLMHGDLSLHGDNLIWDEDLNLRAVVDWEWSHTVPIQCFIPPAWLLGFFPYTICYISGLGVSSYFQELVSFRESVVDRSSKFWPASPLGREWQMLLHDRRHLVALALLYPGNIPDVYWCFVDVKLHLKYDPAVGFGPYNEGCITRVDKFYESPGTMKFLEKKLAERDDFESRYEKYLESNNGGERRSCQCGSCQEFRENFENLQELPQFFYSSDTMQ